jgi:hypothetical protein
MAWPPFQVGKGWKNVLPGVPILSMPEGYFPTIFPTSETNIGVKLRKSREKVNLF